MYLQEKLGAFFVFFLLAMLKQSNKPLWKSTEIYQESLLGFQAKIQQNGVDTILIIKLYNN